MQVLACERVPVAKCPARIPVKYIEALEQNQLIASCCRHPENHEIEAWYSTAEWAAQTKLVKRPDGRIVELPAPPDIYIFHCTCGRQHRRFCVGGGEPRPYWEIR